MQKYTFATLFLLATTTLTARAANFQDEDFTPPTIPQPTIPANTLDVKQFGATGDGKTNDTPAINKAIEALSAQGGGTLHFPAGKYMAASIHLASNLRLLLDNDATIEGLATGYEPPEPNTFEKFQDTGHSHFHDAVLWGEHLENFAVEGGNLSAGGAVQGNPKENGGDKLFAITQSKNLSFKNSTFPSCGHFAFLLNDCENITIDHITTKKSRDVIDLMGCRNVAVHDCRFTGASDDTLGIKSDYALGRRILTENIYAWDDYFESGCNGLQFGSETAGDFKHIRCWNITINKAGKAGIGITSNDSATIQDVRYKHITIKNANCPIYFLIFDRLRTGEKDVHPGLIKDIDLDDITITDMPKNVYTATLTALPGFPIQNVTIENLKMTCPGGGSEADVQSVPTYPKKDGDYSPRNIGIRPASAFYLRHVRDLTLKNVDITLQSPDARPPFVTVDVEGLKLEQVTINGKTADGSMITTRPDENAPKVKTENDRAM